jgi:hypothetical protein
LCHALYEFFSLRCSFFCSRLSRFFRSRWLAHVLFRCRLRLVHSTSLVAYIHGSALNALTSKTREETNPSA